MIWTFLIHILYCISNVIQSASSSDLLLNEIIHIDNCYTDSYSCSRSELITVGNEIEYPNFMNQGEFSIDISNREFTIKLLKSIQFDASVFNGLIIEMINNATLPLSAISWTITSTNCCPNVTFQLLTNQLLINFQDTRAYINDEIIITVYTTFTPIDMNSIIPNIDPIKVSDLNYSANWFKPSNFMILEQYQNINNINFLEIGSFEGMSTNHFIDNYLTGNNSFITCIDPWIKYSESTITKVEGYDNLINELTYHIFLNNTHHNNHKIIINKGLSINILPTLEKIYNFIYIDGDHSEIAVWNDAIYSFKILKINGIIIFDDYIWNKGMKSPQNAIDKFLDTYEKQIELISIDYVVNQVIIKKISDFE